MTRYAKNLGGSMAPLAPVATPMDLGEKNGSGSSGHKRKNAYYRNCSKLLKIYRHFIVTQ